MSDQITNYKCPACTGPLKYDGATGKLVCEYCGSTYTTEEVEAKSAEAEKAAAESLAEDEKLAASSDEWEYTSKEWVEEGMKAYTCPSCCAELIVDETTAATACPFCGNPAVVPGQLAGTLKPDYVIPFKLGKEKAEEQLKAFYKGKPLLPKSFTDENHIKEVKGVYVPFWLYDGDAHVEGRYKGEKIKRFTQGDYEVTITDHYRIERSGDISFENIPADASSKMPDDMMDSIEPYNYGELKEFSTAYLPGFMADKYDVSAEECSKRAVERGKRSALDAMKADVKGYDRLTPTLENATVKQGKISYALLPVWMLSTKFNEQNFLFAMNGQTGRFVGSLPIDKKKAGIIFAIIAAALELIMVLLNLSSITSGSISALTGIIFFGIIPLGIAAIVLAIMKAMMSNVAKAVNAREYITGPGMTFTRRVDRFTNRTETRRRIKNDSDKK